MRVRSKDILGTLLDRVAKLEAQTTAAAETPLPRLLNVADLAAFLRTSPKAVRVMHAKGQLPAPLELGSRRLLWLVVDVVRWVHRTDPRQQGSV